jgi:hypothetical protein
MCPHTSIYVSSYLYVSSYPYMCVIIPLYMCPHTSHTACVLIPLYICPRTSIYVSSYLYICFLISPYSYLMPLCVFIHLYVSSYLYMCPHTSIYVSYLYMCPHTSIYVPSYHYTSIIFRGSPLRTGSMLASVLPCRLYICVLIPLYVCPHTTTPLLYFAAVPFELGARCWQACFTVAEVASARAFKRQVRIPLCMLKYADVC